MISFLKTFGEVIVSSNFERNQRLYNIIVQRFFLAVRKKVVRKVNHFKILEKGN